MAQAVKCKVCGVAHWGSAHVWGDKPVETKPAKVVTPPKPGKPPAGVDALGEYLAAERARKAAYMRDYRARKK